MAAATIAKSLSLHQKLSAIQGALQTVAKTGYNKNQNYNYVTEADLMDAVRPLLAEHQVSMVIGRDPSQPVVMDVMDIPSRDKVRKVRSVYIPMQLKFTDGVTGETEIVYGAGYGEADDDKALYKAQTGGAKYLVYKAFGISTGDDPETDAGIDLNGGYSTPTTALKSNGKKAAPIDENALY